MKKLLLLLFSFTLVSTSLVRGQCVPNCSVYATTSIVATPLSVAGHNTVTGFPSLDDSFSSALPIGFTFTFFCNAYTQFLISTNGFITFDLAAPNNGCCQGQTIPGTAAPNDLIALHWNDLNLSYGGAITYTTIGTAPNRQCIITFTDVAHHVGPSAINSGHIILYETSNEIEIHSIRLDADNGSNITNGTQGIENSFGTLGYASPGFNNALITYSNVAYRYFLGGAPTAPTAISGNTVAFCQGAQETFLATMMPGATSYNWSMPPGWLGTSTISVISTTAGVSGNLSVTATYSCGTSGPTIFAITTISAPVVSIGASPNIICSGKTVTITGSGTGATSYTLYPDGISGVPPFTVTPGVTTIYGLAGVNSSGCVSFNQATTAITVKETPTVQVNSGAVCLGQTFVMTPSGATSYNYSSLFNAVTPTTTGVFSYSVTGTTTTGCVSDPAVSNLTVNTLPIVTLSANRVVMCAKESVSLTAGGASTYTWVNNSATGQGFTVSPLSTTVYTVTGTQAGCSNSATLTIIVNNCTGIEEINASETSQILIYPNPSSGDFTLSSKLAAKVIIYDVAGKIVYQKDISAGNHKIDLKNYAAGNYFLKADFGAQQQSSVIVKE